MLIKRFELDIITAKGEQSTITPVLTKAKEFDDNSAASVIASYLHEHYDVSTLTTIPPIRAYYNNKKQFIAIDVTLSIFAKNNIKVKGIKGGSKMSEETVNKEVLDDMVNDFKDYTKETKGAKEEKINEECINNAEKVEKHVNTVVEILQQYDRKVVKALAEAPAEDAYRLLDDYVHKALGFLIMTKDKKMAQLRKALKEENKQLEEEVEQQTAGKTEKEIGKFRAFLSYCIKKAAALLVGLAVFTLDLAAILGVMTARIIIHTGKEVFNAGKAAGISFKEDVWDRVKQA